jgi:hypothetical protein
MLDHRLRRFVALALGCVAAACTAEVPLLTNAGCRWQPDKVVEASADTCAIVVAGEEVLLEKLGDERACGGGESRCLWLLPGEAAVIMRNTWSSEGYRAFIEEWPCDAPPSCEAVYEYD